MSRNVLVIGNKRYSSWSLRGWLAAKLSGMEFEEVLVPLYQPGTHDKLREVNPAAPPKVPSLKVGSEAVWDTLAICEFLSEQYPGAHLWPEETFSRAHARSIVAEMHSGFLALREHVPMDLSKKLPYEPMAKDVEGDIVRICEIWRECRAKYGANGPFLFGKISIADVFFAPVLVRFDSRSVPLDEICQVYFDTVWALPEFVEWRAAAESEEWTITDYSPK